MRTLGCVIAVAGLLLFPQRSVHAWDAGGHLLVDEIAAQRLNPGVAEKISALLLLLDTQFNEAHSYNLTTAGLWLDDMRGLGKDYLWSKWHYIDIPCVDVGSNDFEEPPPPHVLWAIDQAIATLRNTKATRKDRAVAVADLFHLVGDIHQPLHASTKNDHGGTSTLVAPWISQKRPLGIPGKPQTLHSFWDGAYRYGTVQGQVVELWLTPSVADRPARPGAGVIATQARALLAKYPPEKQTALSTPGTGLPHTWARESHTLGCQYGWPVCPPSWDFEALSLTPDFIETAHEIAERQIVLAGSRLAILLNTLFSEEAVAQ